VQKRLEAERVREIYKQSQIQDDYREFKLHTMELQRALVQATEALHREIRNLKLQVAKFKNEQRLWEKELSERKKCKKEKDRFEHFCSHSVERQREIELEATGDLTAEQEKDLRAKRTLMEMNKVKKANEHASTMMQAEIEEEQYKNAFLSIGARKTAFNPNAIIKACLVQDDVKKDLDAKRKKYEQGIRGWNMKLQSVKASHQDKEYSLSPAVSLSKIFAEKEKILSDKTKVYLHEKQEFEFINKV
jgi:hypothetical protein